MKRKLCLLTLIFSLLLSLFVLFACSGGKKNPPEKQIFQLNGSEITGLTEHGKTIGELVIPNKVNGTTITSIGDSAFIDCTSLTSITIPNSVTNIGRNAFDGCTSITKVNYTGTIDEWAQINFQYDYYTPPYDSNPLYYAKNLYINNELASEINLTATTTISASAFINCTSLTSVTLGNSVTSIGHVAFNGCTNLVNLAIPDSITEIGNSAFDNCTKLTYNEKDSLKYLGNKTNKYLYLAEATDSSMTSVTIDANCKIIEYYTFQNYTNLISVTIPSSINSIGSDAFAGCSGLTKVNYTGSIDEWAQIDFLNNKSNPLYYAKNLYINEVLITEANVTTVTKISSRAFYNCTSLTSITIGNSVASIGGYAFYNCTGLTSITIPNSVASINSYTFYNCTGLKSVTIGNSITNIESYAFNGCSGLEKLIMPKSVTNINMYAFNSCTKLTGVYYTGNSSNWTNININNWGNSPLSSATIYYYVENEADVPNDNGKYWHYVDGTPTIWQKP